MRGSHCDTMSMPTGGHPARYTSNLYNAASLTGVTSAIENRACQNGLCRNGAGVIQAGKSIGYTMFIHSFPSDWHRLSVSLLDLLIPALLNELRFVIVLEPFCTPCAL